MPDLTVAAAPEHCRLVPVFPGEETAALRVCAVVHTPAGGSAALILLASSAVGRAYLGAIADSGQRVLGWVELWVQCAGDLTGLDELEAGTNPELDRRWQLWVAALAVGDGLVTTGCERVHASPVWLDVAAARAVTPVDSGSGEAYQLCTDDAALLVAGLEPFSDSRLRWLAVRGQPGAGFLAPSGEAPSGARPVAEALPNGGAGLLPFNPEGGFLLVRRLAPLDWSQYAGVLSGQAWAGLTAGRPAVKLGGPYASLSDWDQLQQDGTHLFTGTRGQAGRFHESFHLKLRLFLSMLRAVRAQCAKTQVPQLNLTPAAFRVDLPADTGALPVLWAARAVLDDPPAAVALAAPGDLRYFKPTHAAAGASVYRPEGAGRSLRGRGELRIRRVMTTGDRTQIEATLVSPEVATATPRDLVWARLPLPGAGALDLVGNIDAAEALAQGEARFRTAPLEPGASIQTALRAAEGAVFPGTDFRTIPLLSTPVDLYALGVLGVQLFLTGSGRPLPTAVDEVLSLRRALDPQGDGAGPAVRALAASDPRWQTSLGPQHHGHGTDSFDTAAALLPLELWWDTVALLGRFFPGSGPRAFCRDFGDAPPFRVDEVFAAPLAEVENLALRSQSLLLCDWPSNREIARVIQKVR